MGRPRFTRTGRAYTAKSSREYKNEQIDKLTASKGSGWVPLDGPLRVNITFVSPRPKRMAVLPGDTPEGRIYKTTKPDIDNLLKMVLDIITQSEIWEDDNRVVCISCEDYYASKSEDPHTLFTIHEWREDG
jgi:Holliday junction resolvase RusA-like endonuclease